MAFKSVEKYIFNNRRSIGGFKPDIVLRETINDNIAITTNPVQHGAPIANHSYIEPTQITLEIIVKDDLNGSDDLVEAIAELSVLVKDILKGLASGSYKGSRSEQAYQALRDISQSRETMTLELAKGTFNDMMLMSIENVTDVSMKNGSRYLLAFKEIIGSEEEIADTTLGDVKRRLQATYRLGTIISKSSSTAQENVIKGLSQSVFKGIGGYGVSFFKGDDE